jgi:hypothetical protein
MGKRFLHTIAIPNEDLPASATITPRDLPVNPLSLLLLRFQITNANPAAIGTYSAIDDVITQITNVTVRHNGENIISGSLRDLMVLNAVYCRLYPGVSTMVNTNAAVRSMVFPICFAPRPYDGDFCFPATRRGALQFLLTAGADGAGYGDINFSLETVELIEAQPTKYLKYTTLSRDSVAGQFDVSLPIGNPLRGIVMFDTGLAASSDEVLSWGQVKLLKDNVEQYYPQTDYEVLAGMLAMQMRSPVDMNAGHVHQINDGAALSDSDDAERVLSQGTNGYAFMDFDPHRDGEYELETQGASNLVIRATGDEATAIRALPIEVVSITA